jgi:NAD(P)-dependent dehydrogenase (short-subunit alcohol dehydrogenase family)
VNNAAVRPVGTILETADADWDRAFAVNIRGMFLLTRAVLPHMVARRRGVIVNTASGAGYGKPGIFAYSVSKGAVFPFTNALALDYAPHGIRVNAVVPGSTLTGMTEGWGPAVLERAKTRSAAGRINVPEDIAAAIVWLASDAAGTVSGATLEVGTLPRYLP